MRPGEKLHEVLLGAGEVDLRPIHKMISHVPAPTLWPIEAQTIDPNEPREKVVKALRALCYDQDDFLSSPPG